MISSVSFLSTRISASISFANLPFAFSFKTVAVFDVSPRAFTVVALMFPSAEACSVTENVPLAFTMPSYRIKYSSSALRILFIMIFNVKTGYLQ